MGTCARRNAGLSLFEVTLSVAIFAGVIAVSAQTLMSFYTSLDMQEERIAAVQSAKAVMGALREKRTEFVLTSAAFDWEGYYDWVDSSNDGGWSAYCPDDTMAGSLTDHEITVARFTMDGVPANPGDNPIQVVVTATWTSAGGRAMQASLTSVLSDS